MKKVVLFASLFIVLLVAGVAIWAYFAFLYTKPLSKSELAELTPDWSVVTHGNWSPWITEPDGTQTWNPAASFNAWLATVPEDEKAWAVLVDVQYGGSELYKNLEVGLFPEDVEDWGKIIELCELDESKTVIEQLKEAMQRPFMGCELVVDSIDPLEHRAMVKYGLEDENWNPSSNTNPGLLPILQPALGKHRLITQIIRTYSIYELERGNVDEFVELTAILMDSARLLDEFPTLISQLVAIGVLAQGEETVEWAIEHHADVFSDAQLFDLDQVIARDQHRTFLWQGEAIAFHDTIRRMVDDKGSLRMTGLRTLQGGGGSFDIPTNLTDAQLHKSAQRTLYANNKLLKQAKIESSFPLIVNGPTSSQLFDSEKSKLNSLGKLLFDMLSPVTKSASERFRFLQQSSAGLRLKIAARRHALRHGELPASSEAIDKDLLPD